MENKVNQFLAGIFSLTLLAVVFANLVWIRLNTTAPYFDAAGHTNQAFLYGELFTGKETYFGLSKFMRINQYYPPLVHYVGGIVTAIFGFDYHNLQFFSTLLMAGTSLLVYAYINKLTNNRRWALISATLFVLLPQIWEQSRYFMLDLPFLFLILLSLYFLERKSIFLFFVSAGAGMLVKWFVPVYLFIPAILAFRKFPLKKWLVGFLVFLVITAPWYLMNWQTLVASATMYASQGFGNPTVTTLANWLFYPIQMINYQVVSVQFVWLVIAAIIFAGSKLTFKKEVFLQLLIVYVFFSLIGDKVNRFIMPLSIYFVLIMGYAIEKTRAYPVYAGLLVFGLGLFFINSFGSVNLTLAVKPGSDLDYVYALDLSSSTVPYRFGNSPWSQGQVIDDLKILTQWRSTKLLMVADKPFASLPGIYMYKYQTQSKWLHIDTVDPDGLRRIGSEQEADKIINQYDFVLVPSKTVAFPPQYPFYYQNMLYIKDYLLSGKTRDFKLVRTYQTPDGDKLYLLQKNPSANLLKIDLENNNLKLERDPAVARVYFQMMDDNNVWTQGNLSDTQISYTRNLEKIKRIRVDYPPELIKISGLSGWVYDGDKQFDRISL